MQVTIAPTVRLGWEIWVVRTPNGEFVGEAWSHTGALSVAKSYFNKLGVKK